MRLLRLPDRVKYLSLPFFAHLKPKFLVSSGSFAAERVCLYRLIVRLSTFSYLLSSCKPVKSFELYPRNCLFIALGTYLLANFFLS